jgi:uncharacterized protein YecE (DUF72 family)
MTGTLYIGTSGFAFKEWKGPFYPDDVKDREMLAFYADHFPTVEINYTFRRDATEKALTGWRDATPDGFLFSLKANQRITHFFRLGNTEVALGFIHSLEPLGPRLGPVLFQCPPQLKHEPGRVESFLDALPAGIRYAFEFRHPSWEEARQTLVSSGATWCVGETDEAPIDPAGSVPGLDDTGGGFAYLRLRKTSYTDQEMFAWASRIERVLTTGSDVFCYCKHEDKAAGPKFAVRLQEAVATVRSNP